MLIPKLFRKTKVKRLCGILLSITLVTAFLLGFHLHYQDSIEAKIQSGRKLVKVNETNEELLLRGTLKVDQFMKTNGRTRRGKSYYPFQADAPILYPLKTPENL